MRFMCDYSEKELKILQVALNPGRRNCEINLVFLKNIIPDTEGHVLKFQWSVV